MGIKRLFHALKDRFVERDLSEFEGKRFGIDGMAWLYQVFYSISEVPERIQMPIVRKMEAKFKLLQKHNISFIVVMDGKRLEGKAIAQKKRQQKRQYYTEQAGSTDPCIDIDAQTAYERYSQVVSQEIVYFFMDYLKFKEFEFIVAPYEADTQLVHMHSTGQIDYIAGEDSDFFAMNCFDLLRNIHFEKQGGACSIFDAKSPTTDKQSPRWEEFWALPTWKRTLFCVMNGCDYIDNLPRVGFNTLLSFFHTHRNTHNDDFTSSLKARLKQTHQEAGVTFVEECLVIINAFTSQIVYDVATRQLKHMTPPVGDSGEIEKYTGVKFANFERFVAGELDIVSMKARAATDYDFERVLMFINQTTREHLGGIANLSVGMHTFEGFMNGGEADPADRETELSCRRAASRAASRGKSIDRLARGKSTEKLTSNCSIEQRSRNRSLGVQSQAKRALSSKFNDQATRASFRTGKQTETSVPRRVVKRCKAT